MHLTIFKSLLNPLETYHRIYTIWQIENVSMFQQINWQRLEKVISFILEDTYKK